MKLTLQTALTAAIGMLSWTGIAAASSTDSTLSNDSPGEVPGSSPGELFGNLIWVIVSLAIVIVLIVLVIKWLSQRNRMWGANRSLRSLGGIGLGQNSSLQIVEIADRIYVLGVGENITLIDKLDEPGQVAEMIAALERQTSNNWSGSSISELIKKWRNRNSPEQAEPVNEQWNTASTFQDLLQNKLNQQADRKQQLESLLQDSKSNERLMDNEK